MFLFPDRDSYSIVEMSSLPDCIDQRKTREEALVNTNKEIALSIEMLEERGDNIPIK